MNKTISIFCVYLIVFSSIAFAQQDIFGYEETGESILIEVEDYEPKVVPAAILNDQDVPVYVYLKGTSLGGLLGLDIEKAPFYNLPKIKDVKIWPNNTRTERFYAGFNYIKPRGREYTSADGFIDLGYLIVYLQKFDEGKTVRRTVKEGNETKTITEFEKLPDRIDLDFNAKVYFDLETSFGNFGEYSLILKEELNEEEWKKTGKGKFWSGSGYIRASKIENDKAYLQVYDSYLRSLGTVKLGVNDISKNVFRIRYGQELYDDRFRVRLDGIKTTQDKARIRIYKDGKVEERELIEGMKIYPGSDWTVDKISYVSRGGRFEEVVELENSKGDRKYLYREYNKRVEKIEKGSTEVEIGPSLPPDEVMNRVNIYKDNINKVLEDYKNIDANLIKAIIAVESSGNFRAISRGCGAVGLMQLMPGTAKQYGLKVFEDSDTVICDDEYTKRLEGAITSINENDLKSWDGDERFNPEKNIEAGVRYLDYLLNLFNNDLELAIAGYNAGEGSVSDNCKGEKFDDCKNLLPKQTQEYVPKVLDYLEMLGGLQIQIVEEEKIEVKEDVCEGNTIDIGGIKEDTESKKFYCTAIKELKELITKNPESNFVDDANYYIGRSYEELEDLKNAIDYYKKVKGGIYGQNAENKILELQKNIYENLIESSAYLEDEDVRLKLLEVEIADKSVISALIRVGDDSKNYIISSRIKYKEVDTEWTIKEIDVNRNRVLISRVLISKGEVENKEEKSLYLNRVTSIKVNGEDVIIELKGIESKEEAFVTILPGTGRGVSEGSFSVHIPIEDYGLKFSEEQIDKQINWTRDMIVKMNKIIKNLDNIVQFGNKLCWISWGVFTIRNFFIGHATREARKIVMHGLDGRSGVAKFCSENVGYNKNYKSYDDCIYANRELINGLVENTKTSIKYSENIKEVKNFKFGEYKLDYNSEDFLKSGTENEYTITPNQLRQLHQLEKQKGYLEGEIKKIEEEKKDIAKDLLKQYEDKYENLIEELNATRKLTLKVQDLMEDTEKENKEFIEGFDGKKEAFEFFYNSVGVTVEIKEEDLPKSIKKLSGIRKDGNEYRALIGDKGVVLSAATVGEVEDILKNDGESKKFLEGLSNLPDDAEVRTSDGKLIYTDGTALFYSDYDFYGDQLIRNDYAIGAVAEFDEGGKPYCIPTNEGGEGGKGKGGNYIKILEFYNDGTPKTVELFNVGPDGKIDCGGGDDVSIYGVSKLEHPDYAKIKDELRRKANVRTCEDGETINIYGVDKFVCSQAKRRLEKTLEQMQCTDVFSITECQILFNVCDPVMCPSSRFNFGGKYQVDDVVQSGLIGSIVLGLPNWAFYPEAKNAQIIPPICVSGVDASMKAYRSMLQAYNECLQVSKTRNQNVGICERIKSVFWCELAWREVRTLFSQKGSLLNTIGDYSGGGGEYLNLPERARGVGDSVEFFTSNYAKNAFAAYKARTTKEIGTELCRTWFGAKGPGLGDFWNELTRPESPPQFTAFFDEKPWAVMAGRTAENIEFGLSSIEEQSWYSVYYHIYAGEDQDVRYSVFLQDEFGRKAYITDRINGRYGIVTKGNFVDKNIDFIGRSGYKEICVMINGRLECGFGKASTSFGINRLGDVIASKDALKEINSSKECYSEYYGPNIGGVVLPTTLGYDRTGIRRFCDLVDPGPDFERVGDCGYNENGVYQGECWVDIRTVRDAIKSVDILENVTKQIGIYTVDENVLKKIYENLEERYRNLFGENEPLYENGNRLNEVKVLIKFSDLTIKDLNEKSNKGELNNVSYNDLYVLGKGRYSELSKLRIGMIYFGLGEWQRNKEIKIEEKERQPPQVPPKVSKDINNLKYNVVFVNKGIFGIDLVVKDDKYEWDGLYWKGKFLEYKSKTSFDRKTGETYEYEKANLVYKEIKDYEEGLIEMQIAFEYRQSTDLKLYCKDNKDPDFTLDKKGLININNQIIDWIKENAKRCLSDKSVVSKNFVDITYNEYGEYFGQNEEGNGLYILFGHNDAYVRSEALLVNYFKVFLDRFPDSTEVNIIGYASEEGDEGYNKELSEDRAKYVYDILNKNGLINSFLKPQAFYEGRGEAEDFGEGEENYPLNRRVVVGFVVES